MSSTNWKPLTMCTLVLSAAAAQGAPPSAVTLQDDWQGQQTGYWCGPASTRIALSTRGSPPSQQTLANEEGTTQDGTDNVGIVANVLNAHLGTNIYSMTAVNGSPTAAQTAALKANLVATLSNGYPMVINIWSGWRPPFYPGGTIFHFLAVVGYDSNGNRALIADPAGRVNPSGSGWNAVPTHYWIATTDLAVWVGGKGYAGTNLPPKSVNAAPVGYLDLSGCDGTKGWAQDPDAPSSPIAAHVYYGGPAGSGVALATTADVARPDLCAAIGSCDHAFSARWPDSFLDGQPHEVHAYGIDSAGGPNAELRNSPLTATCAPPALSGAKRHVVDLASFAAWGLDGFWSVRPLSDGAAAALATGPEMPAAPVLVQAAGDTRVFVLDSGLKRLVPSAAALASWGFATSNIGSRTAAELEALPDGPALPEQRIAARQSDGAVWVVDVDFTIETADPTHPVASPIGLAPVAGAAGERTPTDIEGGCVAAPASAFVLLAAALLMRRRRA